MKEAFEKLKEECNLRLNVYSESLSKLESEQSQLIKKKRKLENLAEQQKEDFEFIAAKKTLRQIKELVSDIDENIENINFAKEQMIKSQQINDIKSDLERKLNPIKRHFVDKTHEFNREDYKLREEIELIYNQRYEDLVCKYKETFEIKEEILILSRRVGGSDLWL